MDRFIRRGGQVNIGIFWWELWVYKGVFEGAQCVGALSDGNIKKCEYFDSIFNEVI